jgi:putative MATE family efflux protein
MLGNALQSLNGFINSIWVGQLLGQQALAATSTANILLYFLISTIFGLAMATVIMIGKHVGAGNIPEARRIVGTSANFFLVSSLIVSFIGVFFTSPILEIIHIPSDIKSLAVAYTRILFLGIPFSFMFQFVMAVIRGAGDSKTPFYFLMLAIGMDIALNPVLILGMGPFPELGIAGSSLAMGLAQFISLLLFLRFVYAKNHPLRITIDDLPLLRIDWGILRFLITKGIPMGLQMIFSTSSVLVLISLINSFGSEAAAAFGAVNQIISYIQIPGIAIGGALTSIAAQNIGAGKWKRVHRSTAVGFGFNLLFTGVLIALCIFFQVEILSLFLPDDQRSLEIAKQIVSTTFWSYILLSGTFVLTGTVRAAGSVVVPLLITVLTLWGIQIPLAYYWGGQYGLEKLWWSFPAAFIPSIVLHSIYYLSGRWINPSNAK